MELYPKKLSSIDELKAEKRQLRQERHQLTKGGFITIEDVLGDGRKPKTNGNSTGGRSNPETGGGLGGMLGSLLAGGPMLELGMKLGAPLLRKLGGTVGGAGKKAGKNAFRWVTKEVLMGYLKWKAIELSYDGIKHVIESRKKKNEAGK